MNKKINFFVVVLIAGVFVHGVHASTDEDWSNLPNIDVNFDIEHCFDITEKSPGMKNSLNCSSNITINVHNTPSSKKRKKEKKSEDKFGIFDDLDDVSDVDDNYEH